MVTIRALIVHDTADFVAWRGGDAYKDNVIRAEITEHLQGRRVIFLAVTGAEMVGTVQFVSHHTDRDLADGERVAYLQALEVRPEYRQQGIGNALLKAVATEAGQRGFDRLTLMVDPTNIAAIRLYEKWGFVRFKESTDRWRGKEYPTLCMAKVCRR